MLELSRSGWPGLIALCGLLGCAGEAATPAVATDLPAGMTAIDIPPFRVVGDEPAETVEARARSIEAVAALLQRELFEATPTPTLDVWLFRDAASTARHTRQLFGREPDPPEGFYSVGEHAIVVDVSAGENAPLHFLVHAFVAANLADCPVWFDEGLAALYEVWSEEQGRIVGRVDGRLTALQDDLRAGATPDLESFTALDRAGFHGERQAMNRRVARYLCLYLQQQGLLVQFWRELRETDGHGGGYEVLLRLAGAGEPDEIQQRWEPWVLALDDGR